MTTQAYYLPKTVDEAAGLLAEHGPSLMVMAGGTIAMPLINDGITFPAQVMGLRHAGLDYITRSNGHHAIGATTTLSTMLGWSEVPLLQKAAHNVGGWAIRNMGTAGGNLFAPPPSGDFAVALLALDAQVKLVSAAGQRIVPLGDFYTGFMTTVVQPGELVAEIQVPVPAGRTAYLKFARREANTPSIVTVAAHVTFDGSLVSDARLALNGVGPHPLRSRQAEERLTGSALDEKTVAEAAELAVEDCDPADDAVASAWYRRKMVPVIVRRALMQIVNEEASHGV
ncbi:MAG: xanthine dehydrogenase family protein subunit M [Caldilineales bacterium]